MSTSQPTQRDLAAACGVSVATVSLALRGHPRISSETRALVIHMAKELGYHLDPALSHWARQRWRERPESPLVAVLTQRSGMATEISRGARKQAQVLGYRLQRFPMTKPKTLARTLQDAGVRGIILEAHNDDAWYQDFPFEHFVGIAMGMGTSRPPLDLVKSAVFYNSERLFREVYRSGYRRLLWLRAIDPSSVNERMQFGALSGLAAETNAHLLAPLCIAGLGKAALKRQLKKLSPDVIISSRRVAEHIRQMNIANYRHAVFDAHIGGDWSGIHMRFEEIGARAMLCLDQYLSQHRFGPAEPALTIEVPGTWIDGGSL